METQRIIRKKELFKMTALSDTTVWRLEKAGKFPRRIKLGGASVGWLASEIDGWFDQKGRERFEAEEN